MSVIGRTTRLSRYVPRRTHAEDAIPSLGEATERETTGPGEVSLASSLIHTSMETSEVILAARERLRQRFERVGRPESKVIASKVRRTAGVTQRQTAGKSSAADEKSILECLKRFGIAPMFDVETVTLTGDTEETTHIFANPNVSTVVHAGLYVISPSSK